MSPCVKHLYYQYFKSAYSFFNQLFNQCKKNFKSKICCITECFAKNPFNSVFKIKNISKYNKNT